MDFPGRKVQYASFQFHHRNVIGLEVSLQTTDGCILVQIISTGEYINRGITILRPGMDGEMRF